MFASSPSSDGRSRKRNECALMRKTERKEKEKESIAYVDACVRMQSWHQYSMFIRVAPHAYC